MGNFRFRVIVSLGSRLYAENRKSRILQARYDVLQRKYDQLNDFERSECAKLLGENRRLRAELAQLKGIAANSCICCGAGIPEGRQVCKQCEEGQL